MQKKRCGKQVCAASGTGPVTDTSLVQSCYPPKIQLLRIQDFSGCLSQFVLLLLPAAHEEIGIVDTAQQFQQDNDTGIIDRISLLQSTPKGRKSTVNNAGVPGGRLAPNTGIAGGGIKTFAAASGRCERNLSQFSFKFRCHNLAAQMQQLNLIRRFTASGKPAQPAAE